MRPESQSYKLWIGDAAELANTIWGTGTTQLAQLASALRTQRMEHAAGEDEVRRYLDCLNRIDAVLAEYERQLAASEPGGQD